MNSAWLRCPTGYDREAIQLFCLPHAGGNAALFQPWRPLMPPDVALIQVCLPGRLERFQQSMPTSFPQLVGQLADVILPVLNPRWAIFGHSMGGAVAHELTLELRRRGASEPVLLAISGREAPQYHCPDTLHLQSDEALCEALIKLDGGNAEAFAQPEIREFILPAIRADYRLIETYSATPRGKLHCPLAIFYGTEDQELTQADPDGWQIWSDGPFHQRSFSGGHFYLNQHRQAVVNALCDLLPVTAQIR